jgi:hypothetical protein
MVTPVSISIVDLVGRSPFPQELDRVNRTRDIPLVAESERLAREQPGQGSREETAAKFAIISTTCERRSSSHVAADRFVRKVDDNVYLLLR